MLGVGVDIVSVKRVELVYKRHGEHFLDKIFPECPVPRDMQQLAGWFALKEAVIKASRGKVVWQDIKIDYTEEGVPIVRVRSLPGNFKVSVSHESDYAIAFAVWEV